MNSMSVRPTLKDLWCAKKVCYDCGVAWGQSLLQPAQIPMHAGVCDLCTEEQDVSHVRHYGYLRRGFAIVERRQPA